MDKNSLAKLVPSRNDAILAYRVFDGQTVLVRFSTRNIEYAEYNGNANLAAYQ